MKHKNHHFFLKKLKATPGRSAQMELIGLVVIVILITLGMLFLAKFALNTKSKNTLLLRKGLASSSVTALLKTTVDKGICAEGAVPQLKEVLEDCARNYPPELSRSVLSCDNKHSCDFFRDTAQQLLDSTLGSWRKKYEFRSHLIRSPGVEPTVLLDPPVGSEGGCPATKPRDSSGAFPLPTQDAGLIESVLFVCD